MNPSRTLPSFLGAVLAAAVLSCLAAGHASAALRPAVNPVPSLEPAKTQREWRRLVQTRRPFQATACRPLRAVFYAATDWLRLATKLAATASPCAQYYISIPPLAANKTQPRGDQAWRIRALGPSFHAMSEIHMASWGTWVSQNGGSWFAAGQEARRRMATAGYDVALGDTWVVNELSSAVRRGDGAARANAREFVRGLYDGAELADARGGVFVVGIGQQTPDLSVYKANLQDWLADSAFWQDMAAYVENWSQELYGDVRNYAVPGADVNARRDALNLYLQHELTLARVAPASIATARAYLESAYSPLANAAWNWGSAFGWTDVPAGLMQHYVSAQTYALRYADAVAGRSRDHWGFAWAPRNGVSEPANEFTAQTGAILDRLGAAIRDSGTTEAGVGACSPAWCAGDLAGASFATEWSTFSTWSTQTLVFATPPQTLRASVPSAAIVVQLQSEGAAAATAAPLAVNLTSTSPTGLFSSSPAGPWTPTLAVVIPAGLSNTPAFYYLDATPGTATVIASATDVLGGTQTLVVVAPGQSNRQARPVTPRRPITRRGSAGRNVIVGGPFGDRLYGLGGNDLLRGRAGNDRLFGGRGRDSVFGDAGADRVNGGPGRDRLVGGRGADRIEARDRETDLVNCGPGRDRVIGDRRDRISRNCEIKLLRRASAR